jgi:hypothetical protein
VEDRKPELRVTRAIAETRQSTSAMDHVESLFMIESVLESAEGCLVPCVWMFIAVKRAYSDVPRSFNPLPRLRRVVLPMDVLPNMSKNCS